MEASEKTERIDLYLNNQLTGQDLAAFEAQLQQEPALRQEIELQRRAIQAIKEAGIRDMLRQTHRQITEENLAAKLGPHHYFLNEEVTILKSAFFTPADLKNSGNSSGQNNPAAGLVVIPYAGEPNPPFSLLTIAGQSFFTKIKIHPATGTQTFHYQLIQNGPQVFLHLYGNFKPADLTLMYQGPENKNIFKLSVQTNEYRLQPNQPIGPLQLENLPG